MRDVVQGLMGTKEEPGDYVSEDGLLYCGKCHTPKQARLSFNPLTGERSETIVRAAASASERRMRKPRNSPRALGFDLIWRGAVRTAFPAQMGSDTPLPRMIDSSRRCRTPASGMWSAGRR